MTSLQEKIIKPKLGLLELVRSGADDVAESDDLMEGGSTLSDDLSSC
ncbi:hypothetical protein SAMN05444414_104206 [Roseovarius marisflavi]|uniref:Uncharacterized protein n=1 Tax=Roseovarius marisflavi TaxID=1054996 RepID=A0A1M6XMN5_9RHOB|nr:hypothetical protein [Roseovarius marisflavi]SHL07221.1 hypothetical protein SAMN05444414_104206 [Roseovarius marisflavi]